jgi:hypothetical protein
MTQSSLALQCFTRNPQVRKSALLAAARQKGFSCGCAAILSKRLLDGRQRYRIPYKLVKINLMDLYYAPTNEGQ